VVRVTSRLADAGVAVAVTGHERREILEMADRIVWLTAGTTHELGPPAEAVRHPQFRHEYLGPASLPDLEA
jgi:ABC-type lipopolysaccharide export system ATPase subunit